MNQTERGIDFEPIILIGSEGLEALSQEKLVDQWVSLLEKTPHSSVFQHPTFVLPWYQKHEMELSPVLLLTYSSNQLVGFLALARKKDDRSGRPCNKLFGAGEFYALYQNWIILPEFIELFWTNGIQKLLNQFPGCSINLKSLNHIEDFKELSKIRDFRNFTVIEKHHNPVLDFGEESFKKVIVKRHLRSKFNRLNRAGKVEFKKIESVEDLDNEFSNVEDFYNLRHGAAFNKIPFPKGKNERQIFLEWFKKGIIHASALYLDGQMIGAILLVNDFNKTVHLAGLITYSPNYAKYSPGLVHLYLLIQLLKEESFLNLKLSPGNDAYKERFSNSHEVLYELLISKNIIERLRRKIRKRWREFVLNKGIRPMEVGVYIDKSTSKLKNRLHNLKIKISGHSIPNENLIEKLGSILKNKFMNNKIQIKTDDLSTLLIVDDFTFDVCRWEFLEDALKRLDENQFFVTIITNKKILACLWFEEKIIEIDVEEILNNKSRIIKVFLSKNLDI
jgi:hypothetical protein